MKYTLILLFSLIILVTSQGQKLSLEEIMKGEEFIGFQPNQPRWSYDGSTIYFNWNPENEPGYSTYLWKNGMQKPLKVTDAVQTEISKLPTQEQKEFETLYYIRQGGIYAFHKKSGSSRKVFFTSNRISNLSRGSDPDILFFQQGDNMYRLNVKEVSIVQITNFKKSKDAEKPTKTNYLRTQEKALFQYLKDKEANKKWMDSIEKADAVVFPKEYIYEPFILDYLSASPNGQFVCFGLSDYPKSAPTKIEQFITADGYTNSLNARSKVSVNNLGTNKTGIYHISKDSFYFPDFSSLTGINEAPEYYKEYEALKNKEKKAKLLEPGTPVFNNTGNMAVLDIRSQDNKDRWIVSIDLATGTVRELDHQHDEAWIHGPGIGYGSGILGFLPDNSTVFFQSEESGYSHLYLMDTYSGIKKQITSGEWEVREVTLSKDGKTFFISANKTHPGNREFYHLDIASGKLTGILQKEGASEVVLSPDEKKLLVRYSFKNQPWELYICENKANASLFQITYSTTEAFKNYNWQAPEVISFKATDGGKVYARLYEPKPENKNKAAVIFVHGAGYLQNAHNFWSSYFREYMFHHLLTEKGFTVLDIDYRGSDGYGRNVRTGIYRHMGGLDLADHLDGKQYLVEKLGIDKQRVGIYGGSYGGFITLMALLTKPGTFKCGAALRSVTDWAHYNHGYTSNILNFPETDSIAYRRSSPIYFAENLQDHLLMLHGMVDDNVQFQDVVRLSQRFIELGKKDWNLAVYPVESHGFKETYSWVDEYRRILELFEKELLQH